MANPNINIDLNAWLQVGTDGKVRFYCDRSEMGQGVYTALPMLIAEVKRAMTPARQRVIAERAQKHAVANQAAYNIVALNMSLGGGSSSSLCPSSVFASFHNASISASVASFGATPFSASRASIWAKRRSNFALERRMAASGSIFRCRARLATANRRGWSRHAASRC